MQRLCLIIFLQPPLVLAILIGGYDEVVNLLKEKQDPNFQDSHKRCPLHAAAFKGDSRIVEALIMCGAVVNTKDSEWLTPLHRACCNDNDVSSL